MKVECEIHFEDLETEDGRVVPGVRAICTRCGHETESFGTEDASVRRCLAVMREECPEMERNYYVSDVTD